MLNRRKMFWRLIIAYFSILFVIVIAIGLYFSSVIKGNIIDSAFSQLKELASKSSENIDKEIKSMNDISIRLASNQVFVSYATSLPDDSTDNSKKYIMDKINNEYIQDNYIQRITYIPLHAIYDVNLKDVISTKAVTKNANLTYGEKLGLKEKIILSPHDDGWDNSKTKVISLLRPITKKDTILGYIEIQKSISTFKHNIETRWNDKKLDILITDGENNIFYGSNLISNKNLYDDIITNNIKNYSNNNIVKNQELVVLKSSNYLDWKIALILNKHEILYSQSYLIYFTITILTIILLLTFLYTYLVTKKILLPLDILIEDISNIDINNISDKESVSYTKNYEAAIIASTVRKMKTRIYEGVQKEKMLSNIQTKATFEMLQSKIGPHFLYNTLSSIASMCNESEISDAQKACFDLSDILRYSANYTKEVVLFSDELENAEQFLSLMKTRYRHRLNFEFQIESDKIDFEIPKLTLQPLIENAIKYALSEKEEVKVLIFLHTNDEFFVVEISDNGCGFDFIVLEKIQKSIEQYLSSEKKFEDMRQVKFGGMGLIGTVLRLYLNYGENFSYSITKNLKEEEGSTITLNIPRSIN